MGNQLLSKWTASIGCRSDGEVYGAVCAPDAGSGYLAYVRVEDSRESLVFRSGHHSDEMPVVENTYILSPRFAGNYLIWSERLGGEWRIRAANISSGRPAIAEMPFSGAGRPASLFSSSDRDGTVVVWEERSGRRTKILLSRFRGGRPATPVEVTNGDYNAYDPTCCIGPDGFIYVAYCAFKEGQYRIELQRLTEDGQLERALARLSNQATACVHPSICLRRDGGVWFSYTSYQEGIQEQAYVQDLAHRGRKRFFEADTVLYAGCWDEAGLHAVHAPPNPKNVQGLTAAMVVYGSGSADYGRVFTDSRGRVRLLMRRHAPGKAVPSVEKGLVQGPRDRSSNGSSRLAHPGISLATLADDGWQEPECLIVNGHAAAPISFNVKGDLLRFAYTSDTRRTGWSRGAEWFDDTGQLAVGIGEYKLTETGSPNYSVYPFRLNPRPAPSIEETTVERHRGGYLHALGQTHMHTNLSVCIRDRDRDPHMNYRFTQDVQHSDFAGTTDHAYNMWQTEMMITRKLAEYYYFPGEFVAIPAYEWTGTPAVDCSHEDGPWGHVNPQYLEEEGDLEFYTPTDPSCRGGSLRRLAETYGGKKILCPPHHVADFMHPYNWEHFFEKMQPIVELFQDMRGSGEQPFADGVSNWLHREEGGWVLEQLMAGRKLGFIAGADHGGIARAGVLVTGLTRAGLYEALTARRCFATTGGAATVDFSCNGVAMGGEVRTERAEFIVNVAACSRLYELQIVRDGETVERIRQDGTGTTHTWTADRARDGEFWYVRILLDDGEILWTSPIWLTT